MAEQESLWSYDYCQDALKIIKEKYNELIYLPIDLILPRLHAKNVITSSEKERIHILNMVSAKMEYFLDYIIMPSLQVGHPLKFELFLEAMEESGNSPMIAMAKKFNQQLEANYIEELSVNTTDYYFDVMKNITENYVELIHLPIDSMLPWLVVKKVITMREKQIIQTLPINSQKMEHLLDYIILPSLQDGITVKFEAFVEVMEESSNPSMIDMAKKLNSQQKASYIEESSVKTADSQQKASNIEESSVKTAVYCFDAKKIIRDNYNELLHLPFDSLLSRLFVVKVITSRDKQMIETLPLNNQKMEHLLLNIIMPSLQNGITVKFKAFLEVMEESSNPSMIDMAKKLNLQQIASNIEESSVSTAGNNRPTIEQLMNYKEDVTPCWHQLGSQLLKQIYLYSAKLDIIHENYHGNSKSCCTEMLQYWLQVDTEASWDKLMNALKEIGFYSLAKQIQLDVSVATEKMKLQMLQSLSKAREDGCLIKVRYGKVLICGASEAGKTNFLNLLLEDDFQPVHISTKVAESQRTKIAVKAQVFKSSKNQVIFTKMKIDDEIDLLKSYLPKKYTKQPRSFQDDISDIHKKCTIVEDMICKIVAESTDSRDEISLEEETNLEEETLPMQQPTEKIWDILTFMDTGGQPQFISMLPAINSYAMITFIVQKLTEPLNANVVSKHRDAVGKDSCMPYKCEYNYHQLITTLMSYASSVLYPDKKFLNNYKVKALNKDKITSSISIIGTHSSDIDENDIKVIDNELEQMVHNANADNVKPRLNSQYECLVPVDSKTQEKNIIKADTNNKKYTDPLDIRKYIYKWLGNQDIYYVPIQWLLLELEIRKICIDRDCKFITYDEVLKLSKDKDLGEEDFIRDGLRFHHLFGVLLYFEEVKEMRELIIVDHQWLFDKLTAIVLHSFENKNYDTHSDYIDFKKKGIFKETVLDELDINEDFTKLKIGTKMIDLKKSLLDLLQYLRIIAPLNEDYPTQYFMPSLLRSFNLADLQQNIPGLNKIVTDTGEDIESEPLLIQFKSPDNIYSFPRGFFSFLVVELMHSKNWKVYKQAHHNLLSFNTRDIECYVTLIDKIICLEIQVTRNDVGPNGGIFIAVRDAIVDAFYKIKNTLSINVELKFGFWCKECESLKERHISLFDGHKSCYCINDEATKLQRAHLVWFVETFKNFSINQAEHLEVCPEMKQLQDVMRIGSIDITTRWHELGLVLSVGYNALKVIKADYPTVTARCCEMFNIWLERTPDASWNQLVAALHAIDLHHAANVVSQYCKSDYVKCSDRVPKASSSSIQDFELRLICSFLHSVESRFRIRVPPSTEGDIITDPKEQSQIQAGIDYQSTTTSKKEKIAVTSSTIKTTHDVLDTEPNMWHIISIVIPRIKAKWEYVAYSMQYSIPAVDEFAKDSHDSEQNCLNLFKNWLNTPNGVFPKTWCTLLVRIKAVDGLKAEADDIEREIMKELAT